MTSVAFSNTTPLREEIGRVVPSRPFRLEFWDGSSLPPTENGGGPTFTVRSPKAVARALAAPGQLGLGRAYVTGDLAVDDIDAVAAMADARSASGMGSGGMVSKLAAARIAVEQLPGYAPALNPDEGIWNYPKRVELRNRVGQTVADLGAVLRQAAKRLRRKRPVLRACLRQAGYHV